MSPRKRRTLLIAVFLLLTMTAGTISAQVPLSPNGLEVIDATNWQGIRKIADLGYGHGGIGSWSEDGRRLYYWSSIGIYAFDVANPSAYTVLAGDAIEFPSRLRYEDINLRQPIATSPDGRLIARIAPRVSDERNARLIVLDSGSSEEVTQLSADSPLAIQRYSDDIVLPQFAEDGRLLYMRRGSLYQWDERTNAETLLIGPTETDSSANFTDIRLNAQGTHAATYSIQPTYSQDNLLTIFDLRTQPATVIFQLTFPALDSWHSIAFSPDGREVATGGSNANIRISDLANAGRTFHDDNPPNEFGEQEIVDLAYTADGRYLVGCIQDIAGGYAFVRDAQTGETLATLHGLRGTGITFLDSVATHPTENLIAFGGGNGTVQIWPITDLIELGEAYYEDAPLVLQTHEHVMPVADVNFSADGTLVASASWDGTVTIWNYATNERLNAFVLGDLAWSAMFSPDGSSLATSSEDGRVILWDRHGETARLLDELIPEHEYSSPYIVDLAFNHDGSLLAGAGHDGALYLWTTVDGARRIVQEKTGNPIWHLQFSRDGTMLVTASPDTTVRIWGVPSLQG